MPRIRPLLVLLLLTAFSTVPTSLNASRVVVRDNGAGTTDFPPFAPLGYESAPRELLIRNGLPPNCELIGRMRIKNIVMTAEAPGGSLGGHTQEFAATLELEVFGLGVYGGYHRTFEIPLPSLGGQNQTVTAPRAFGTSPQSFDSNVHRLLGMLPPGDPDFDLLRVAAGDDFGLPAPGHTTITRLPDGNWAVDSFFDITYRVDFVGKAGGPFTGMSGSTTSHAHLVQGQPPRRFCTRPDNGSGTADLPPDCPNTGYASPPDATVIADGLPLGEYVRGTMRIQDIVLVTDLPGGALGGDEQTWTAKLVIEASYDKPGVPPVPVQKSIPVSGKSISGPRDLFALTQGIPMELTELLGQITDSDFGLLRFTSGSNFGYPSPGHVTLRDLGNGQWTVDSFFDITYRVDFIGDAGGPFAGMSGSPTGSSRFDEGVNATPLCLMPDIGGTALMLPDCPGGYVSSPDAKILLDGLPPDSPIVGQMTVQTIVSAEGPGGGLGGNAQHFSAKFTLDMHGIGVMSGYTRSVSIPVTGSSETADRPPGTTPQSFPMNLVALNGEILGDPDFDFLRVTAGTFSGFAGPGHSVLVQQAANWSVDSFFDVTYRIDFVGAPGGPLAGMSGSTVSHNRFQVGPDRLVAVTTPEVPLAIGAAVPNPARAGTGVAIELSLPEPVRLSAGVFDAGGRRVRTLENGFASRGPRTLRWDGRGADGRLAAPGLYFVRVEAGVQMAVRKVVVSE